jgi:hypothetical protein
MTRAEIIQELMAYYKEGRTPTNTATNEAAEMGAAWGLNVDPDLPKQFKRSELAKEAMALSDASYQQAITESPLSDNELLQVLQFLRSPIGRTWQQVRVANHDRIVAPYAMFSAACASYSTYLIHAKVMRQIAYAVHFANPNLTVEQTIDIAERAMRDNPFKLPTPAEDAAANGRRLLKEIATRLFGNNSGTTIEHDESDMRQDIIGTHVPTCGRRWPAGDKGVNIEQ